jgi:uncharacterized protein (DUF2062 family)
MPKKLIKRYAPDPETIRTHKYLAIFSRFFDANLFHLNRRSVSGAVASGLFWAMIPVPFQMIAATITAILARTNLPISVALVWLTNPLTIPPFFYFNYIVGIWLLGESSEIAEFEPSIEWIMNQLSSIWLPLYTGSLLVGVMLGLAGYISMRAYWRWYVVQRYKKKRRQ